jgi:hypothetical protein
LTTTASTVAARIPISSAPRTRRVYNQMINRSPTRNTAIGHPWSSLAVPSCSGGTGSVVEVTNPASMKPMIVMKRPIPTAMACLSANGTASITARRKPVNTRARMMTPSVTTTPMASGHVS